MMKNKLFSLIAVLGVGTVVLTGCGGKKEATAVAGSAVIPGANIVFSCDLKNARTAPIYQQMKDMQKTEEDLPAAGPLKDLEELWVLTEEVLGLSETDINRLVVSAKFLGEDVTAIPDNQSLEQNFEVAFGIETAKELTLDQLQAFMQKAAESNEEPVDIRRDSLAGTDVLVVADPEQGNLYVAAAGQGRTVLGGTQAGLQNALGRLKQPVGLKTALDGSGFPTAGTPQMFLSCILSEKMKNSLDEKLARAAQAEGTQGTVAACLQGMSGATLTMNVAESLNLGLFVKLASGENATQLQTLFDNMAVPSIKLGVSMMTQGKPLPMLNTISSQADGNTANVSLEISKEDFDVLKEVAAARAAAMVPTPPPPTMP